MGVWVGWGGVYVVTNEGVNEAGEDVLILSIRV